MLLQLACLIARENRANHIHFAKLIDRLASKNARSCAVWKLLRILTS